MIDIPPTTRGLIFDCDGTLTDTMPLHYQAWVAALRAHGHEFPESLFYALAGIPTHRIADLLNEEHGYKLPAKDAADLKERLFVQMIPGIKPIEPVVALVRKYAGIIPMAVATGGTRNICGKTLTALGILQYFQTMVTADDVEHGKPAPDIFLEAARRLGAPPELCYAFEDGELGLQSARAAGMVTIDIRPWLAA